ncbi:MAG: GGDEF domain-containing protein [Clostridia bacterium]
MKLFTKFKDYLFGNVDSKFYIENKNLLEETNYSLLKKACIFSTGMCAFLFLLTFFNALISNLKLFYLFYALFFLVETLLVLFVVNKHKKLTKLFFYIYAIAILYLAADIGTIKSPDVYAVTFYVFLIIIPMLHICKPIYAIALSASSCAFFCILTSIVKQPYPLIYSNDILNAVCCCIVGIGLDVTIINLQLTSLQNKVQLEKLSLIDELTGLSNRRHYNTFVNDVFSQKPDNVSIIMLDIDSFKSYNDVYGHLNGDNCLQKIGKVLREIATECSFFVSRIGGEEFVAVCVNFDNENVVKICDLIMEKVDKLNVSHKSSSFGKVTVSIGYANSKGLAMSRGELATCADKALYFSKSRGKNCISSYEDTLNI